ncbi:MAG: 1-deoxy-D-xylulose-5-phosphate synthase [Muribaculaceae bacterium]|nr:1-deoxy-D-xylulose-5-phosphate synthase [Muribaculaceae bacterium]
MEKQEIIEPIKPVDAVAYPLLSQVDTPEKLRKLGTDQLPRLGDEIRSFLINSLSQNPGHFGSSMGAVDFTIALHYVFNTPYDRIVWDVGHQAYAHKILTGRRDSFPTIRTKGGLSGFPNPAESEFDSFTAGHASNSVSAALGMAVASEMNKEQPPRNVIAVIGDASISGGLAFEGLNNAANTPNNLLILLNDNNMSIDRNVGSLHRYLGRLHSSKFYNKFRYKVFNLLKKLHLVNEKKRGFIVRFNNSLKSVLFKQQNIFEGLNIRYFGPYDGHDIDLIIKVLEDIKDQKGPRILHLKTKKGKGLAAAEQNPMVWHAPGKFNPETGEILTATDSIDSSKFQDVFGTTLLDLAKQNDKIVGVTAAMPTGTSISIMREEMPERVFDVGISEGHAVTFAGGLAKEGLKPFVAIYSSFLQRGYDNIIHDVAIQKLPVVFCIDRAGLVGEDGVTHHGVFDLAYLNSIPGIIIASPRNESELRNLMYLAQLEDINQPIAIRYPRGKGKLSDWRKPFEKIELGTAERLSEGKDVTVISLGPISTEIEKAIALVREKGIGVTHYDARFLRPLDEKMMQEVVESGRPVITVEDASVKGGLGSTVIEWLNEHDSGLTVRRIGVPEDRFIEHGTVPELYRDCEMDSEAIYKTILEVANK